MMKLSLAHLKEPPMIEGISEGPAPPHRTPSTSNHTSGSLLPEAVLVKCTRCRALLYRRDWHRNQQCCLHCGYHFRLTANDRIRTLVDADSFVEIDTHFRSSDPLHFKGQARSYPEKLAEEQAQTGLHEAVVSGTGSIEGQEIVLAVMDFHFIGGSMGAVVGEKITRAIELALKRRLPLVVFSASGGARMQEGIFSLMQMAKTTVALSHLNKAGIPFISVLTDPTTGGVLASFAMLGDIILAEPEAVIGFAGPRVIEQFTHQSLPKEVDTSEFMFRHGMIDAIVQRSTLRSTLAHILRFYAPQTGATFHAECHISHGGQEQRTLTNNRHAHLTHPSEAEMPSTEKESEYSPWEEVQLARHKDRPHTAEYIRLMSSQMFELHGDRRYGDDAAVIGALANIEDQTVMIIGHQKGHGTQESQKRNFGMPHPEGYRKAQRLMQHAEKFGFPLLFLIDTPGAFPGLEAEQRGQAQAIAESMSILSSLHVPIISVVIGEGGSGGALAFGLADRVLMLEHSIYTVASPEAAASILWRNNTRAMEAAQALRITSHDLLSLGVIDGIIPEPPAGAHRDYMTMVAELKIHVLSTIRELQALPNSDLLAQRHLKFRNFGRFSRIA